MKKTAHVAFHQGRVLIFHFVAKKVAVAVEEEFMNLSSMYLYFVAVIFTIDAVNGLIGVVLCHVIDCRDG